MGKIPGYIFLFLLVLSAFNAFEKDSLYSEEDPNVIFQKAEALFNKKKYPVALSLYEKVISIDSSFTKGYRGIIRCYNALGDPQGAVIFMESLFLENPESAEVSYGMGYALYSIKKYNDAIRYFEKAVMLNQDLAAAWNNCAVIYHFITHDYEKAGQYYKKAISISKRTGDDWVLEIAKKNLAHLHASEELKPVTEQLTLEEFINSFISRVGENNERGIRQLVLGQKKNCEQAMDWLLRKAMRSCAEGKKEDEKTTILLAKLLEKEYRGSFKGFLLKNKLDTYNSLSDEKKKKIVEGEELLEEGLKKERQGMHGEAQGNYKEALLCFETINDKSRAGLALLYLGDIYRKMKRYSLARDAYTSGLTHFIETGEEERKASILSSLGITYVLLGEHSDALDFHNRSLTIYRLLKDEEAEKKVKRNIELIKTKIQQ
jgi:tetratricopeptide (TPR) repeat protein